MTAIDCAVTIGRLVEVLSGDTEDDELDRVLEAACVDQQIRVEAKERIRGRREELTRLRWPGPGCSVLGHSAGARVRARAGRDVVRAGGSRVDRRAIEQSRSTGHFSYVDNGTDVEVVAHPYLHFPGEITVSTSPRTVQDDQSDNTAHRTEQVVGKRKVR